MSKRFSGAIRVNNIDEEHQVIHKTSCSCGSPFISRGQSLLFDQQTQKRYDLVNAACIQCGSTREFLFDISAFFGKSASSFAQPPANQAAPSMRQLRFLFGVCVVFGILAALIAFGPLKSTAEEKTVRAMPILLGFCVLGAVLLYRKMSQVKNYPPGDAYQQASREMNGKLDDMQATLGRLGLALDFSQTNSQTTLAGGIAKASIYRGCKSLEADNLDDAIQSFTIVINNPLIKGDARLSQTVAVAHYLRGGAYERKGMLPAALDDYSSALTLWPAHEQARQARERLNGRA